MHQIPTKSIHSVTFKTLQNIIAIYLGNPTIPQEKTVKKKHLREKNSLLQKKPPAEPGYRVGGHLPRSVGRSGSKGKIEKRQQQKSENNRKR